MSELFVVATPIGNLEDITHRAVRILSEVDLIAAEDTRQTKKLLTYYNINTPMTSYHKFNIKAKTGQIIDLMKEGKKIALVSDSGMPGISDPGYELIKAAHENNITVVPIPGPSALVAALSVSGLPTESFLFYGFLPSKATGRQRLLFSLKDRPETLIFYESPKRLRSFLEDASRILGERQAMVAREMTKVYEEVYRGTLSEVLKEFGEEEIKGEVTIVLEGSTLPARIARPAIEEALELYYREMGLSMKRAIDRVSEELEVSKRDVYQESLRVKRKVRDQAQEENLLPGKNSAKTSGEQES